MNNIDVAKMLLHESVMLHGPKAREEMSRNLKQFFEQVKDLPKDEFLRKIEEQFPFSKIVNDYALHKTFKKLSRDTAIIKGILIFFLVATILAAIFAAIVYGGL